MSQAQDTRALSALAFDYAEWRFGGNDARQPKACSLVKLAELRFGALSSAGHYQHVEIDELAEVRFATSRNHRFHQNQLSIFRQRTMRVLQDRNRLGVIPIVNDPLQYEIQKSFRSTVRNGRLRLTTESPAGLLL